MNTPSAERHGAFDASPEARQRDVAYARRRPNLLRILVGAVLVAIGLKLVWLLASNPNFEWSVVWQYMDEKTVLKGLTTTLVLTVVAMILGVALGLGLAMAKLSDHPVMRGAAEFYISLFRGTPLMVQLLFWYNLSTLFPRLSVGIPFGPDLISWNANDVVTPLTAAIVGLALNEAAYMAEIIRGGLIAVDPRQIETAQAFGMTRLRAMRRIVIPQAMRSIVPPTGNQVINMVKATAMVSVIAMGDLLHSVQDLYNANFKVIPLLMVAVIWYLLITSVLNVIQGAIERHYGRSEQVSDSRPHRWFSRGGRGKRAGRSGIPREQGSPS